MWCILYSLLEHVNDEAGAENLKATAVGLGLGEILEQLISSEGKS